ncbi:5'-3' exonuclease [Alteromonas sp. 14N.309.X.WAT.G.H12]|uniref:5'-3' exonuclease n=1 Tax=Alteromonas sp. 14N.309.X.WAT.G.H12 TaxID=3120824 RepID=UPI002FD67116
MKPYLYAFDVNAIFGRAFPHTHERVSAGRVHEKDFIDGHPVYTLRETLRIIRSECQQVQRMGLPNSHIVMVCDHPGKNFRHKLFAEYKANRPPKPKERSEQERILPQMLKAAGYPVLCIEGVEADDVLATLSTKLSSMRLHSTIFTGDKDLMSLCNEHTTLFNGKLKKIITETDVLNKFGVSGELVLDLLSLSGDTVDNVPGVKGISETSAAHLLQKMSLSDIIGTPEKILKTDLRLRKAICKQLKANPESAVISRKLVALKCDVPLNMNFNEMRFSGPDKAGFLPGFFDINPI